MNKVGFGFLDRPPVREQLRLAQKAEALGYDSLWVTETRLARDAAPVLGAKVEHLVYDIFEVL